MALFASDTRMENLLLKDDWLAEWNFFVQAYASRGYIAVAIDSRYHGERASNETTYLDVISTAFSPTRQVRKGPNPQLFINLCYWVVPQN